ncbi:MAG: HTH-type transcriptional regulator, dimethyl sulfoxide reductase transcription regulator [Candidatus Methanomethylophilaceae archaeon]|nr:HTH-type transcriptional regulator, dimethyl sulfoxide reductase transcription regulator [Candidatus Methanomethylophilaceae archaeon]
MHCYTIRFCGVGDPEKHPCRSILPIPEGNGIKTEVMSCSMMKENAGYAMIRITNENGEDIPEGIFRTESGRCSITMCNSKLYLAIVINDHCELSALVNASGCFLMSAVPVSENETEWTLIGPSSRALHGLLGKMRDRGYEPEVVSSEKLSSMVVLTPREEECFGLAWSMGYYDIPKQTNLDEMCRVVGCSKSTLDVTLRSAERRIFEFYRLMNNRIVG